MRRIRDLLGLSGLLLAVAIGCATDNKLQRPDHPEEFRAPPESDPRYSRPIEYPKDTMDQDSLLKKGKDGGKNGPGAKGGGINGMGGGTSMGSGQGGPAGRGF
jgi:hypothetical protein